MCLVSWSNLSWMNLWMCLLRRCQDDLASASKNLRTQLPTVKPDLRNSKISVSRVPMASMSAACSSGFAFWSLIWIK